MRFTTRHITIVLVALLSFIGAMPVAAELIKDTSGKNYMISSKDDLIELMSNTSYWNQRFIQTADIDLSGVDWTPIGNGTIPFRGTYNGMGHTISNLRVVWDRVDEIVGNSLGLFGYIGEFTTSSTNFKIDSIGVKNLNIDNAHITRTKAGVTIPKTVDVKLGIVAGQISARVFLTNISVTNSRIDDGGRIEDGYTDPLPQSLYAAGVVGDITSYFNGTTETLAVNTSHMSNIYVDVDIDLSHTTHIYYSDNISSRFQYLAGGVVGRLRKQPVGALPTSVVFTGTINAPGAMVGPFFVQSRHNTPTNGLNVDHIRAYAGENTATTIIPREGLADGKLFYDYRIMNYFLDTPEVQTITDTYPSGDNCQYGTRTLRPNNVLTSGAVPYDDRVKMMSYQGVNVGTYSPSPETDETVRAEMLDMLSSLAVEGDRQVWQWNGSSFNLTPRPLSSYEMTLKIVPHLDSYVAEVYDRLTNLKSTATGTWKWYSCPDIRVGTWTEMPDAVTNTIVPGDLYYKVEFIPDADPENPLTAIRGPLNIVYVYNRQQTIDFNTQYAEDYPDLVNFDTNYFNVDGDDQADGHTPFTPVKTMRQAYLLLDDDGDWDNNFIVVMGYLADPEYLKSDQDYCKAATITGTDRAVVSGGLIYLVDTNPDTREASIHLSAPTRFEELNLFEGVDRHLPQTAYPLGTGSLLILYCEYHDFTVGSGVCIYNYKNPDTAMGLPGDINNLPNVSIVAGILNYNHHGPIVIPENNREPGRVNIELRSGAFFRVIGAARNTNTTVNWRTSGTDDGPNRVKITVNINSVDPLASNDYSRYGYSLYRNMGTGVVTRFNYTHDIGLVSGGQTDGSAWCDTSIDILDGRVARLISGSITYGRLAGTDEPDDSFFGRTVVNIYGGEFNEVYGGSLGRSSTGEKSNAFFYGQSEINMYGGKIKKYTGSDYATRNKLASVAPNLYGAGAGAIVGLGTSTLTHSADSTILTHTFDEFIPYHDADHNYFYGNFDTATAEGNIIPVMTMFDGTVVDLSKSTSTINLYGGEILGDVYGGGHGFSNNISYDCARPMAGTLYGDCNVNLMRQGNGSAPLIHGNLYGAGAGTDFYHNQLSQAIEKAETDGDTELAEQLRAEYPNGYFDHLGMVFGNVTMNITGGTVLGDVFAGSQGIIGRQDMASVFGEISTYIGGDAVIMGDIYGGCEFGSIYRNSAIEGPTGNTVVTIEGNAVIGNRVFGGTKGIVNDNIVPIIEGNTTVNILGGRFYADPWLDASKKNHRNFNIYGGGFQSCVVTGNSTLNVETSPLVDITSICENADDFASCWEDRLHRRFCLYGGGYGEETDVRGTTLVNIDMQNQDILVDPERGTFFYPGRQFFDVVGGGFTGNVQRTQIDIKGNVKIRKVIGGGFYGSSRSTTNTTLTSGCFDMIVGGCLMGYVNERANLTIGTHTPDGSDCPDNASLWVLGKTFGGNDVQGIIGLEVSNGHLPEVQEALEKGDIFNPAILYRADVDSPEKGIKINIYGGTFYDHVYGTGNGHYRGYYVPGWNAYTNGPERFYRLVPARRPDFENNPTMPFANRIYKTRPTVGRVSFNIQGNSETDRVNILQSVFGGGSDCTIGQWNSNLQLEDPRRLTVEKGGHLSMNFGSHVTVGHHTHLGAQGLMLGSQPVYPDYSVVETALNYPAEVVPDKVLDHVGDGAYYHWYYDGDDQCYKPGFAPPGKIWENPYGDYRGQQFPEHPDKAFFLSGGHTFYGMLKFMEMACKVSLTFDDDPWDANGFMKPQPSKPEPMLYNSTARDIRFNSFFLGGEHGFMTYEPQGNPTYAYDIVIPGGVTIEDKVVAGTEDGWIRFYQYSPDFSSYDENDIVYEFNGGLTVQSRFADSNNPSDPLWLDLTERGYEARIVPGDRRSDYAIRLTVSARFDPILDTEAATRPDGTIDDSMRYGGLIYGGCYTSGLINGNVVLNVFSDLLGSAPIYSSEPENENNMYNELSLLRYNVGRVFGGGYGDHTVVEGDTHVHLLKNFRGFNVFGGAMMGDVNGCTNISYIGTEKSCVYGSIYGGGLIGNIGLHDADGNPLQQYASKINLISGNVDKVYGGACMGDVYGGTYVYATDNTEISIPYLDEDLLQTDGWGESRLIAGHVYGGNDIAGRVYTDFSNPDHMTTTIHVHEDPNTPGGSSEDIGKDSPGAHGGYNGFPLIGNVYGGSNGNYGNHADDGYYGPGSKVYMATGNKTDAFESDLNTLNYRGRRFRIPWIDKTRIDIEGGTLVNVYGGGNKSTIARTLNINVQYADTIARAGFSEPEEVQRMWNIMHLSSELQFNEVLRTNHEGEWVFSSQIFRMFGGNNNANMSIQPRWRLNKGHIGSLYSGGNIGHMNYFNPSFNPTDADVYNRLPGLAIYIDSPDIRIDNVYGGGRIGKISAHDDEGNEVDFSDVFGVDNDEYYGANVYISNGIIEHVYGGNDVAGEVRNGSRVNISGAISGNVYGAGNGNYLYRYDTTGKYTRDVTEEYDDMGRRIFVLKAKPEYGYNPPSDPQTALSYKYEPSSAHKILAINSYRPHVSRSRLDIRGIPDVKDEHGNVTVPGSTVYVKGSVYCGGNSSTVTSSDGVQDIIFHIGSNVMLNGVFLGSNGERLTDGDMIFAIEELNDIDMIAKNSLTTADLTRPDDLSATDHDLYPINLSLYMRAVEVTALPKELSFDSDLSEAYIGEFCIGGNSGSMLTDKRIHIKFPESLVIYKRIIGGCYNANVSYRGKTHVGGLTKPVASSEPSGEKVRLDVACRFLPLMLQYPTTFGASPIALHGYMLDVDGKPLYEEQEDGTYVIRPGFTGDRYYADGQCNIYGGCYTSGRTVGNIVINLYSDMLDYGSTTFDCTTGIVTDGVVDKRAVINSVNRIQRHWRSFDVFGGGFGAASEVFGNIDVRLLPSETSPYYVEGRSPKHPSVGAVFGGSQNGLIVGNTTIELRDGTVLTNVYGASESAKMYGSSSVLVGYPEYYTVNDGYAGEYGVERADDLSTDHPDINYDHTPVIRETIMLRPGDIVPVPVYNHLKLTQAEKDLRFTKVDIKPSDIPRYDSTPTGTTIVAHPVSWNDILIEVGDQYSQKHKDAPFYAHGNIYGGGFLPLSSDVSLAGSYTVTPFEDDFNLGTETVGYGGNASVLIWDNPRNADSSIPEEGAGAWTYEEIDPETGNPRTIDVRDHISVSTGRYELDHVKPGGNVMGKYILNDKGEFVHLPSGEAQSGVDYYKFVADGGVYGGGRKVFVKGLRTIDVANYGYADHCPQSPKLINTFQRADMVYVKDCCIMLQGATDFATNVPNDYYSYSVNRVGELRMMSTIPADDNLNPGRRMEDFFYNIDHYKRRSRNYIAFFNTVHYLGAFVSSVSFGDKFHDEYGVAMNGTGENPDEDYITHKHNIINYYEEDIEDPDRKLAFNHRNIGTAANMVGISNGIELHIKGSYTVDSGVDDLYETKSYYGPIFGVAEIKLLTLAQGEGGGYIYALNHHYDADYDTDEPQRNHGPQGFLHTTGNFVFPGAAFITGGSEYNYVVDNCYPMNHGYYELKNEWNAAHGLSAPRHSRAEDDASFDANEEDNIHYWYVNGQWFTYNLHLTAYSGNTADNPAKFFLPAENVYAYLAGVEHGSDIYVKSVTWGGEDADHDLKDLSKPYGLEVTIDKNSQLGINPGDDDVTGAYVVSIPRTDYVNDPETPVVGADGVPNDHGTVFGPKSDNSENAASLGIRLTDGVNNGSENDEGLTALEYFNKYLKEPQEVQIVLGSNTYIPDQGNVEFKYTINLTIHYLLGPDITGNIVIENCALPGEYIYANANDVDVTIDPSSEQFMAVTKRSWYLYPVDSEGNLSDKGYNIDDMKLAGTDREVRLPAYWYQNGWRLLYRVVVNGVPYDTDCSSSAEHTGLEIHNYHRMRAFDGTNVHNLKLVKGARVYIEDNDDIKEFFSYLTRVKELDANVEPVVDPDEITYELDRYGIDIDPANARGINFYLQSNVELPNVDWSTMPEVVFEGDFHGNGKIMDIGTTTVIPIVNGGRVYNLGFRSWTNDVNQVTIDKNYGEMINCYYFNENEKGALANSGTLRNCYQNTPVYRTDVGPNGETEYDYDELMQLSSYAFRYGQVAYNLNGFYLDKRDKLLRAGSANDYVSLNQKDRDLCGDTRYDVDYIEDMFNNGDYQYAYYLPFDQFKQALRTAAIPNYLDMMDLHAKGQSPTFHDTTHPHDDLRWEPEYDEDDNLIGGINRPRYSLDDYIFFGQDISPTASEDALPSMFTPATRVYRASGYYNSMTDKGSFFNRSAYIATPLVTAIDVTGFRDKDADVIAEVSRLRALDENNDPSNHWDGWIILPGKQEVFYPPTIDMPYSDAGKFDVESLTISNDITRNLLIYSLWDDDLMAPYHYATGFDPAGIIHDYDPASTDISANPDAYIAEHYDHDYAAHPDDAATIRAHHLVLQPDGSFRAHGGYFHLVDKEDFNAPIAFTAAQAWYNRQPLGFANGTADKNAWEGVYLPFDVAKVFSRTTSSLNTRDHGELTHFYDSSLIMHEYWLRRFVGVETIDDGTGSTAMFKFQRPTPDNDAPFATVNPDRTGHYNYFNDFFYKAYREFGYVPAHDEYSRHHYFDDYRYLTHSKPYIVTYPGERYLEFDMSGEFYRGKSLDVESYPQSVCYFAPVNSVIPVTDLSGQVASTSSDSRYSLCGTFSRVTATSANPIAVIDEYDPEDPDESDGSNFKTLAPGGVVYPFRVYMNIPSMTPKPMKIKSGDGSSIDIPVAPGEEKDDEFDSDNFDDDVLNITIEDNQLVVLSSAELSLTLFDMQGRALRILDIAKGRNFFSLPSGLYLLHNTKFYIR